MSYLGTASEYNSVLYMFSSKSFPLEGYQISHYPMVCVGEYNYLWGLLYVCACFDCKAKAYNTIQQGK